MGTGEPNFTPVRRLLASVTNGINAQVTTTVAHGYFTGQWVRLIIPGAYGMVLDYVPTLIEVLSDTQFETQVDTSSLLPFVSPSAPPAFTQAQVVPISGVTNNVEPV